MRMTSRHFGQTLFQDEFTEIRGKKRIRCKIEVILSIWYVDNLIWLNIKVDKNYSKCVRTKDKDVGAGGTTYPVEKRSCVEIAKRFNLSSLTYKFQHN